MVLNNTCDLQPGRSPYVNIALVADFPKFETGIRQTREVASANGYIESVRENKVSEIFFVERCPGFGSGMVVFLNKIATVPFTMYEKALSQTANRQASLSQHGFYYFLIKLTRLLARPESEEVTRQVDSDPN